MYRRLVRVTGKDNHAFAAATASGWSVGDWWPPGARVMPLNASDDRRQDPARAFFFPSIKMLVRRGERKENAREATRGGVFSVGSVGDERVGKMLKV